MRIDINSIDPRSFDISKRYLDGIGVVYLITPGFDKHSWEMNELHLRSLLLDENFNICSSGFPKFFNCPGEKPDLDKITYQAIASGNAWYPEKLDGSLIIRSVICGQVHIRTRGSHTMDDRFAGPIMDLIKEKYPNLLDSTRDTRYSLLFEFTSPEHKVILDYPEPCLTVLGMMDLTAEPPEFVSSPEIVQKLSEDYGTPAVKFYNLNGTPEEVIEQIKCWKDCEGVVAWCPQSNGKLHLAKIKTSYYLRLHSLKFNLTDEKIRQFCWYKDVKSIDELKNEFFKIGVDWEFVSFIQPVVEDYLEGRKMILEFMEIYFMEIERQGIKNLPSRKEQALALRELDPSNFHIGIGYVIDDMTRVQNLIDARILGISEPRLRTFRKEAQEFAGFLSAKISKF